MICNGCGREIADESTVCEFCGDPVVTEYEYTAEEEAPAKKTNPVGNIIGGIGLGFGVAAVAILFICLCCGVYGWIFSAICSCLAFELGIVGLIVSIVTTRRPSILAIIAMILPVVAAILVIIEIILAVIFYIIYFIIMAIVGGM